MLTDMFANPFLYWFAIYLAIGLPVLLLIRLLMALRNRLRPESSLFAQSMTELEGKDRPYAGWRRVGAKVLTYPLALLIWPLGVVAVVQVLCFPSSELWTPDPQAAFHCQRQHLIRVVSPDAAEAAAKVADPLGRAPDVPFGHLNAGWRALLADKVVGDSLWYFEIPGYPPETDQSGLQWSAPRGAKRGYALVQSGKVRAEFVFEWDGH